MAQSIHDFHDDPRNDAILICVNGELKPRAEAVVSVFDSGFVLGDGVWEGLRVARRPSGLPRRAPRPAVRGREGDRARHRPRPRGADAGALRDAGRQRDDRRRAHPADGHARRQAHAVPGSARHDRAGDGRDHRRVQGRRCPRRSTRGSRSSPCTCAAAAPTCRTRSSTRTASSTASPPASRPHGRRRRGADARPARLRRDLQLDALLHRRARGEVWTSTRRLLPRRHHPRQRAASLPRGGHPGVREELQPDRRLRRRRGLRAPAPSPASCRCAAIDGRTIGDGQPRADGRAAAAICTPSSCRARRRARARPP